ncbi:RNA polymerase sigma-70 factor [Pararcticibacter amylolyticus]|nr:RNA polymerase sigma-70 factor [Pararcticibacter amylolyticus]
MEKDLLLALKENEPGTMEAIFQEYWEDVFSLAMSKTGNSILAGEITQDIFVSLWENRHRINLTGQLKHYLLGSVKFRVINYYKSNTVIQAHQQKFSMLLESGYEGAADEQLLYRELSSEIECAISALPDRMRAIFSKSRKEGKSNREIAAEMKISVQTVKNQTSSALKILKEKLPHLTCFFL